MYSICVVSNDETQVARLKDSIKYSFSGGVIEPPEIIVIDGTKHDIFTGYNAAIELATNENLIFVHHDVEFLAHARCWEAMADLLKKPSTGFLGVAGTTLLTSDGIWWSSMSSSKFSTLKGAAMHGNATSGQEYMTAYGMYGQVAVLDGVCLMARKKMVLDLGGFDSNTFKGFDFYDIDITTKACVAGYKNYAMPILIKHYSPGDITNKEGWHTNRTKYIQKWSKELPLKSS